MNEKTPWSGDLRGVFVSDSRVVDAVALARSVQRRRRAAAIGVAMARSARPPGVGMW